MPQIMNWLGHEGLIFVQTVIAKGQENHKTSSGIFKVPSDKFMPQHNEMILS